MILDEQNQLSDSQAVTSSAVATNVIDLNVARSIGSGEPMAVLFNVEVDADQTTGDEDYTFDVETSSDAGQSTAVNLVGRRIYESGTPTAPAQNADLLVAGYQFAIALPPMTLDEAQRYLGVRYVTAGTTPTITVSAHLVPMSSIQAEVVYPKGYTITG